MRHDRRVEFCLVALALFFFLIPGAYGMDPPSVPGGWFSGFSLGQADHGGYELEEFATSLDDTDTGYSLFGGYHFTFLATSVGYVDLGKLEASGTGMDLRRGPIDEKVYGDFTDTIEAKGFVAWFHGLVPAGSKTAIVGSLGLFSWEQDVQYEDAGGPWSGSATGASLAYGLGVVVSLNSAKTLVANIGWTRYTDVGDLEKTGHELDITHISGGLTYYFGK